MVMKEQLLMRYEFKLYCLERALERCDYDAANIFSAQAAYIASVIDGVKLDVSNRNDYRLKP